MNPENRVPRLIKSQKKSWQSENQERFFHTGLPDRVILVLHGPEIFDAGGAALLIDRIRPSRAIVAGVMARTAAEESNLPVEFQSDPPSYVIRSLSGPVVLANHGKTAESGRIFGDIIASRLTDRGLVQIEYSDRIIYVWDNGDTGLASALSHLLGFALKVAASTRTEHPLERRIRGCIPREAVYVNGIIIGQASAGTVVLRLDGGKIVPVSGLVPKIHGIEKIERQGLTDLSSAWCKSGSIRSVLPQRIGKPETRGTVLVIDHCGHEIYSRIGENCCGVLAIGDDTTAVCGHICVHLGIPVFGIVDGDRDTIIPESFAPGSVVVEVRNGRDDDLGLEVAPLAGLSPVVWENWVGTVLDMLGDRVRIIIDFRERSDAVL